MKNPNNLDYLKLRFPQHDTFKAAPRVDYLREQLGLINDKKAAVTDYHLST